MSSVTTDLKPAWEQLLRPFGAPEAVIEQQFTALTQAYAQPERHYHTLAHIRQVLDTVAFLGDEADHLPAVHLAAWFHDAIYEPRAGDNEERSAALAGAVLAVLRVPPDIRDRVQAMILATKTHQLPTGLPDCRILLDADLAILGAEPADYDRYAQAIRREYAWVSEADFRAGRLRVLQHFLERPRIYLTDRLFHKLERRARQNLQREIAG